MKIVRLEAENVKRLVAVSIKPDGTLCVIGGRNGQGKSSLLDAIEMALGGKDHVPEMPVRKGEATARVVCDLGDIIVTRTFKADGHTSLVVSNREGARFPSPQSMLDKLVGQLSFDPIAFARMAPREQRETLRELVGLDFSGLDAKRAGLFEERTAINRATKVLEARLQAMPEHPDAPAEPVVVADLVDELEAAKAMHAEADESARAADEWRRDIATHEQRVEAAKKRSGAIRLQIEELQAQLSASHDEINREEQLLADQRAGTLKASAAAAEARSKLPDLAPIREKIAAAEGVNAKVRANAARQELALEAGAAVAEAEKLTNAIEQIDFEKGEALAGAAFPVPGLSFDESGVLLNGVPFSQASSAEQLRVSVAMGLAANPRLRVLLIRDGSLLDEDSLRLVAEMAAEADAQVWLERVSDDGVGCSVVIEDGAVKATGEAAA